MNKQIARALVLKNFTEAKGLIFGSLYAKSSLAMDEARYEITKSMFNTPEESEEIIEEETEQLDELSPELLGRYIKKANRRAQSAAETIHAEVSKPLYQQNNTTKDVAADELIRRTRGIHRATARIVPKTIGEETEQLDEVRRTDTQHPNDRAGKMHRLEPKMHRLEPRMQTVDSPTDKSSRGYEEFFRARAKKQGRPLTDEEHTAIRAHRNNDSKNKAKRSAIR